MNYSVHSHCRTRKVTKVLWCTKRTPSRGVHGLHNGDETSSSFPSSADRPSTRRSVDLGNGPSADRYLRSVGGPTLLRRFFGQGGGHSPTTPQPKPRLNTFTSTRGRCRTKPRPLVHLPLLQETLETGSGCDPVRHMRGVVPLHYPLRGYALLPRPPGSMVLPPSPSPHSTPSTHLTPSTSTHT